jgi:hypothetical protein
LGCARVLDAQPAVAFESGRDEEPVLSCREPVAFGAVPRIEQDMSPGPDDRLKGSDGRLQQFDLSGKGHLFRFADGLLSIQLWSQRTASPQQHIQVLD